MKNIAIIGAGLAGCECALYLAKHNKDLNISLFEQKPDKYSLAHSSGFFSELVCSNSLRSADLESGIGLLKQEMRELGSNFITVAEKYQVPAGKALAVDRDLFAKAITEQIHTARLSLVHKCVDNFQELANFDTIIIAAGPMLDANLCQALASELGQEHLYFYDAIAPIISLESINMDIAFWASRYGEGEEGDYLNCPMNKEEYQAFYQALMEAEKVKAHNFEQEEHFEGCMPIEALAERGERTLVFGPLKPVGFTDPRSGKRPYAILQLRMENLNRSMFNLVGCQTKLTYAAQDQVFRLVPGLEQAKFVRYGSMHRNTYVDAPNMLNADLSLRTKPNIFVCGQISGVEGYVESAASGLYLAALLTARLHGQEFQAPPVTTALGALLNHLQTPPLKKRKFQPSNVHFGLMPEPDWEGKRIHKKERKQVYAKRARQDFAMWLNDNNKLKQMSATQV